MYDIYYIVRKNTINQRTMGPVAHLSPFIIGNSKAYGRIFNLSEIFISANMIMFQYKKWVAMPGTR